MTVAVSAAVEQIIRERMATGHYASEDQLLSEALLALSERDRADAEYQAYLKREVAIGIDELDQGKGTEYIAANLHELFDEVKQEGRRMLGQPRAQST